MKKLLCVCAAALLFTVSGCSDATTSVTDGSTALITVGNTKITKENVYTGLKTQGAVNSIINMVTQIICDNEIPLTDEIKAEAQSTMDSFKGYVGEENWDAFIKGNGYASEEDYFNQRVVLAARAGHITEKYLEEDWSNVISVYKPRQVQIFTTDDEEVANKALEAIKGGKEVADVVEEMGGITENYNGSTQTLSSESGLPTNVWGNITKVTENNTVLDEVQYSLDLTTYYVVKVIATNPEDFKETAIKGLASSTTLQNEGFAYYLKKYNFNIYDIDIYNAFKTQAPQYLVQ